LRFIELGLQVHYLRMDSQESYHFLQELLVISLFSE
jgi:hypothetical protein